MTRRLTEYDLGDHCVWLDGRGKAALCEMCEQEIAVEREYDPYDADVNSIITYHYRCGNDRCKKELQMMLHESAMDI